MTKKIFMSLNGSDAAHHTALKNAYVRVWFSSFNAIFRPTCHSPHCRFDGDYVLHKLSHWYNIDFKKINIQVLPFVSSYWHFMLLLLPVWSCMIPLWLSLSINDFCCLSIQKGYQYKPLNPLTDIFMMYIYCLEWYLAYFYKKRIDFKKTAWKSYLSWDETRHIFLMCKNMWK